MFKLCNSVFIIDLSQKIFRSSRIGLSISADYYYSLWGLNEGDVNYDVALSSVHERAAKRILAGCLKNGGLYVKLGQGLVVMDHILPKEYINTLRVSLELSLSSNHYLKSVIFS